MLILKEAKFFYTEVQTFQYTCHSEDIFYAQKFGQIHNSVAGDVHVRGDYPGFAARFFEENEINLETMPEDDEILKNGTGDFSRIRKDSFYWYKKVIESCGEKL